MFLVASVFLAPWRYIECIDELKTVAEFIKRIRTYVYYK